MLIAADVDWGSRMTAKRDVPWFPIVSGAGVVAIGLAIAFGASALSGAARGELGADLPAISPTSPSSSPTAP